MTTTPAENDLATTGRRGKKRRERTPKCIFTEDPRDGMRYAYYAIATVVLTILIAAVCVFFFIHP